MWQNLTHPKQIQIDIVTKPNPDLLMWYISSIKRVQHTFKLLVVGNGSMGSFISAGVDTDGSGTCSLVLDGTDGSGTGSLVLASGSSRSLLSTSLTIVSDGWEDDNEEGGWNSWIGVTKGTEVSTWLDISWPMLEGTDWDVLW